MTRPLRTRLEFIDIIVLACIFFGDAAVRAVIGYLDLRAQGLSAPPVLDFSADANYRGMAMEIAMLLLAFGYLYWRRFDWRVLDFSVNRRTIPLILLFIVSAGAVCWLFDDTMAYLLADPQGGADTEAARAWSEWATQWIAYLHMIIAVPQQYDFSQTFINAAAAAPTHAVTVSHVLFALLNGFYEELFFLGLVFAVRPRLFAPAFAFSLFVRFIFHVYQGLLGAASITTLGIVFFFYRRKIPALVPFMLAHSFFDVYGLNMGYWLYLLGWQ